MREDREAWTQWAKTHDTISGAKLTVHTRPSTNKYQARSVRVDGILFDSQREVVRYQELKRLALAGVITDLEVHPGWPLIVSALYVEQPRIFQSVGWMFHADFKYQRDGQLIVEDVKSKPTKTEAYKLRKKIVEAVHGITITEIA
jgi:hypothetical protein